MSVDFSAVGANGSSHTPGKHRGPRFSWTPAYEATFFRSLCESVELGLREGSTFKQEAWDRAINALIKIHNAFAHKNHLINKSDNARKKFRLWRGLVEDPEFEYSPVTRTVTASEDAWKRHIEKEPLSRSLKGRPFEHEEFYAILFPDVVGSGGAPKRLTKTRRKDDDPNGLVTHSSPTTTMMDILSEQSYTNPPQTRIPPPVLPPALPPSSTLPSNTIQPPMPQPLQHHNRPVPNAITTRTSIGSSLALTPPEDPSQHSRKRFQPTDNGMGSAQSGHTEKRRRTVAPQPAPTAPMSTGYIDLSQVATTPVPPPSNAPSSTPAPPAAASTSLPDWISVFAETLRSVKTRPVWSEQAMDLFFRDFVDEDPDLQLKIAEKVLSDENKAMVFCKMPDNLRKHWVRRLREMHNQRMS